RPGAAVQLDHALLDERGELELPPDLPDEELFEIDVEHGLYALPLVRCPGLLRGRAAPSPRPEPVSRASLKVETGNHKRSSAGCKVRSRRRASISECLEPPLLAA